MKFWLTSCIFVLGMSLMAQAETPVKTTSNVQAPNRLAPPPISEPASVVIPKIEKRQLSNGIPVWFMERRTTPLVTACLFVKAGAVNEPLDKMGLAALTAECLDEDFINVLYSGSDCILANSGHEPFGLVGLEVMACGGLAFVGATGEDYAQTLVNSAVVETEDPLEIVEYVQTLTNDKKLNQSLRTEGKRTAACYTWERICRDLFQKIRFLSASRGVILD